MSKAILVLDEIPKYCAQCDLEFWAENEDEWMCPMGDGRGAATVAEHYNFDYRPEWCPLREMPERKEASDTMVIMRDAEAANRSTLQQIGYNRGWNDCLDRLEGNNDE